MEFFNHLFYGCLCNFLIVTNFESESSIEYIVILIVTWFFSLNLHLETHDTAHKLEH